jgi:hypothetical protein
MYIYIYINTHVYTYFPGGGHESYVMCDVSQRSWRGYFLNDVARMSIHKHEKQVRENYLGRRKEMDVCTHIHTYIHTYIYVYISFTQIA